jgi:3-oxoacyl-[acyl-carrier protein] reductase
MPLASWWLQRCVSVALDVVCNAGGPPPGNFAAFPEDQPWLDAINLNLMSTLRLSRAAVPHLEAQGGRSITNIVSISVKTANSAPGAVQYRPYRSHWPGTVVGPRSGNQNIRVNSICPGSILTDRIRSISETGVGEDR